jgi:hypothetical protein
MIYGCGDMTPQHNSCGQYSHHCIDWRHDESFHVEQYGVSGASREGSMVFSDLILSYVHLGKENLLK